MCSHWLPNMSILCILCCVVGKMGRGAILFPSVFCGGLLIPSVLLGSILLVLGIRVP